MLGAFWRKLKFNRWQFGVKYPKSDLEHLFMHHSLFKADFNPSLNFPLISTPLPLPQMKKVWGLATLIIRLKFDNLMKVLMLILLGNQLLVVGIRTLLCYMKINFCLNCMCTSILYLAG